jgi:hypothetical protein
MTLKCVANYSVILPSHHLAEQFYHSYSSVETDHTVHIFLEKNVTYMFGVWLQFVSTGYIFCDLTEIRESYLPYNVIFFS